MKLKFFKALLIVGMVFAAGASSAQSFLEDPKYGPDRESRQKNVEILNFFYDAYKTDDWSTAAGYLQHLLQHAPKASENIYIYGINMYRNKISTAKTADEKNVFVDSLMSLYDLRGVNFGDNPQRGKAYILGMKAMDFVKYQPAQTERQMGYFKDAIAAGGSKTDPTVIALYYKAIVDGFTANKVETNVVIEEYDRLLGLLDQAGDDPDAVKNKSVIESLFATSGAADCENLESIFKPKYEADPNNVEQINKILSLLNRAQCNSTFRMTLAERLHGIEPSANSALSLAVWFENQGNFERAFHYYDEAISLEKDPMQKEKTILRVAALSEQSKNFRKSAEYARQAIAINPNSGSAYYLLARAYALGASSACSTFDAQTVFWLAVDNLNKAKGLLSNEPAQVEEISKMIGSFATNFPNKEEIFFRELTVGDAYTVNCSWISGRTTVRAR